MGPACERPPFPLTAKLDKLTIKVDRPQLSPEDIKKLQEETQRARSLARCSTCHRRSTEF
jgi:hypothetical protein